MKKNLLIILALCGIVFTGCSNVKSTRIREKTEITEAEKGILFQVNETEVTSEIYEYLHKEDWRIFESKNSAATQPVQEVEGTSEKKGRREEVEVLKPIFELKYDIKTNVNRGFGDDTYSGYITVVDTRKDQLVSSIRFKDAEVEEIVEEFEDQLERNIDIND